MKKALFCLTLAAFLFTLLMPVKVVAAPPIEESRIVDLESLFQLFGELVGWIMMFVILVAVVMIIWAGFNFITASGDETKTKKGKSMLTYALIGVAIVLAVRGLITLVGAIVGVDPGPWLPW